MSLPSDPLWSTPGPSQQTATGHWPPGSPSLWSVRSAAGRTPHGKSCGSWWGWGRCDCRWTAVCRWVQTGWTTGWMARTGGADGQSGGRLEVRMGERRQTLGFFQLQRKRLNSGGISEGWQKKAQLGFCGWTPDRGNLWSSSVTVSLLSKWYCPFQTNSLSTRWSSHGPSSVTRLTGDGGEVSEQYAGLCSEITATHFISWSFVPSP